MNLSSSSTVALVAALPLAFFIIQPPKNNPQQGRSDVPACGCAGKSKFGSSWRVLACRDGSKQSGKRKVMVVRHAVANAKNFAPSNP
jgi:hypothetical protein